MKLIPILPAVLLLLRALAPDCLALTVEETVTPAYLRAHPDRFTVKAAVGDDGLLNFTVNRTLWDGEPRYLVAHLRIARGGKTITESHTPVFTGKGRNPFHFSVAEEDLEESSFTLSKSAVLDGHLVPGGTEYRFQLESFIVRDNNPAGRKKIAGDYYRGNRLSYDLELHLAVDGTYRAQWHSCVSKPGVETGKWTLSGKQIAFAPSKQDEPIKGRLRELIAATYDGDWILLPAEKEDRKLYDSDGVTRLSCFQRSGEDK